MMSVSFSRPCFFRAAEDLARAPVDLLDRIAVEAALRRAAKLLAHRQRHVRHRVRDVEEKRPFLVALDEAHRALGVLRR